MPFHTNSWVLFTKFPIGDSLLAQMVKNLLQYGRPGFSHWREWLPTSVFLPGEFHGQRSLAGYSSWGRRVGHGWATNTYTFFPFIGPGWGPSLSYRFFFYLSLCYRSFSSVFSPLVGWNQHIFPFCCAEQRHALLCFTLVYLW